MTKKSPSLNDMFKPGQPLPPDDVMISTALDILNQVPHGQQLVDFASVNFIQVKVISTPQPVAYLPDSKTVYIGFNPNHPISPQRFILALASMLREAQQEAAGILHAGVQEPLDEHKKRGIAKFEDKVWHMCTIACELNSLELFAEYGFLDTLRQMGYDESLALFLKQQEKGKG